MAIDPSKLKAFAQKGNKPPAQPPPPAGGESPADKAMGQEHGETPPEGSHEDMKLDALDNLSIEAMRHRLMEPQVGYIETPDKIGALACGECRFLVEGKFCANQSVTAYVSADKGHCNLFVPLEGELVDPEDWEGLADAPDHGAGENMEDDEDEPEDDDKGEDEDEDKDDDGDEPKEKKGNPFAKGGDSDYE